MQIGVVPGSGAIPTPAPPRPGAVPGSEVAPITPALDAVPGNRAISDAVPGISVVPELYLSLCLLMISRAYGLANYLDIRIDGDPMPTGDC